jgi:hypothetical protein
MPMVRAAEAVNHWRKFMISRSFFSALFVAAILLAGPGSGHSQVLFSEDFDDVNLSQRGWYDGVTPRFSTTERTPGSTRSVEFRFRQGATKPDSATRTSGQGSMRKKFQASDSVYIRFYVKYSANWVGSQKAYHPHEFYILTNKSGDWTGPAFTQLTFYVEQNGGRPQIGIQDGVNVDKANIGKDLTRTTERRAVAGCNGDSDGYGKGECYAAGSNYWNGKMWRADNILFGNTKGSYYKNDWHLVEAYIKLNSIVNGKGVNDGIMQYWFDGQPVIDRRNVVIRTGQHADMKFNQLIIGPWIGNGSPVDQTFWVDKLLVARSRADLQQVSPPSNLKITSVQ